MKNDIKNVAVTFSLIALMLYSGSFLYEKKAVALTRVDEQAMRKEEERLKAEELIKIELGNYTAEQERLANEKLTLELAQIEADALAAAETQKQKLAIARQSATKNAQAIALEQTAFDKAQQAAADALAVQKAQALADQKAKVAALAAQIAAQKAAAPKTTTVSKTRVSRAS